MKQFQVLSVSTFPILKNQIFSGLFLLYAVFLHTLCNYLCQEGDAKLPRVLGRRGPRWTIGIVFKCIDTSVLKICGNL